MKYLIVSADDFGLTKTTNQGIAKAYNEGIATCIQFMPSGAAFEHALGLAQELGLKVPDGVLSVANEVIR